MEVNKEFKEEMSNSINEKTEAIRVPVTVTIIEPYNRNKSLTYLKIIKKEV